MCDACIRAEKHPNTGRFNDRCDGCAARSLALSPMFHASLLSGQRSPQYSMALAQFFKDREQAGHQLVVRWFKRMREAKRAAATSEATR